MGFYRSYRQSQPYLFNIYVNKSLSNMNIKFVLIRKLGITYNMLENRPQSQKEPGKLEQ